MTFEDFVRNIKDGGIDLYSKIRLMARIDSYNYCHGNKKSEKDIEDYCFFGEACIGGTRGIGSWGSGDRDEGDSQSYSNPEGVQEATTEYDSCFDKIMMIFCPNISFLPYKMIYSEVTKRDTYSQNEYYGNSSNKLVIYCILEDLYNSMTKMGLI